MKIVSPSVEVVDSVDGGEVLKRIERAGRTCYKSEDRIDKGTAKIFVKNIIKSGHESVLEHEKITVRIVTDRAVANELVRHRLASYSQESTRYVKYDDGIKVIKPIGVDSNGLYADWRKAIDAAEMSYFRMLEEAFPDVARSVLPLCTATEIVMTANLREWRHILKLRTDKAAHPDMRALAFMILDELKPLIPVVFDDVGNDRRGIQ